MNPFFSIVTIAGSDNSSGAGIQNDIRTATLLGGYATTVITAVTVQSPDKLYENYALPSCAITEQLETILQNFPIKSIKTGMLHLDEHSLEISKILKNYSHIPLIIDPIFKSTSGGDLTKDFQHTKKSLFPLATIITPNKMEAEKITGMKINNFEDILKVGKEILNYGMKYVLIKGGHIDEDSNLIQDVLISTDTHFIFKDKRLNFDVRGTGCRLSTAIACFLAQNYDLKIAIEKSKIFLRNSMENSFEIKNKRIML